ncbi:MAG TPA: energy transducer TonB, partial [Longimicrobium sp.]
QLSPDSLRRAGTEGTVLLRITVEPGGRVRRGGVDVVSATHPEFALAARRLVQRLRFRPATLQGREVAAPFTLPVAFVLHDR